MKHIIIITSVLLIVLAFGQADNKVGNEVRLSPRLLNYQGYLTDTLGNPITNPSVSMMFSIYDAVSSGNLKWIETQSTVSVNKGVFHVLLGSVALIPDSVFNNTDRWLELSVAGQTLAPRTRIVSAPYAYTATYSDTSVYARNSMPDNDWIISGSNLYAGVSGGVGIGTASPWYQLHIYKNSNTGSANDNAIAMIQSVYRNSALYLDGSTTYSGNIVFSVAGTEQGRIVYNYPSNYLAFNTNNAERLRIDASGNVGIGTTSPGAVLTVNGTGSNYGNGIRIINGANYWESVHDMLGGLTFGYSGTDKFVISRSGNSYFTSGKVGILTANPAAAFAVSTGDDRKQFVIDPFVDAYTVRIGMPDWYGVGQLAFVNGSERMRIDNNGNVGIGTATPGYLLDVAGTTRTTGLIMPTGAVNGYVLTANTSGVATWQAPSLVSHNHIGQIWSSTTQTTGLGINLNVNYSGQEYGYYANMNNTAASGWTYGGYFDVTAAGTGICGICCTDSAPAGSATDIYGAYVDCHQAGNGSSYGGRFYSLSAGTGGVYGIDCQAAGSGTSYRYGVYSTAVAPVGSSNSAYGVYATTTHNGTGESYGGRFTVNNYGTGTRRAVYGVANAPTGSSNPALSINGDCNHAGTGPAYGAYFAATGAGSGTKYGVYAEASGSGTLWAGYFSGNVEITGSHGFANGFFVIDHPLDPKNMILRHNTVESPENLCLYRGKVKLNSSGEGKVEMPSYFKALTKETEATVTLTSIGRPFNTGYDWNKDYTQVTIYGESNREVSYIVMADRDDPVMHQLYKPVEEEKGNGNFTKGKLLYPKAYGYPEEMGEDYERQQEVNSTRADAGK